MVETGKGCCHLRPRCMWDTPPHPPSFLNISDIFFKYLLFFKFLWAAAHTPSCLSDFIHYINLGLWWLLYMAALKASIWHFRPIGRQYSSIGAGVGKSQLDIKSGATMRILLWMLPTYPSKSMGCSSLAARHKPKACKAVTLRICFLIQLAAFFCGATFCGATFWLFWLRLFFNRLALGFNLLQQGFGAVLTANQIWIFGAPVSSEFAAKGFG